MARDFFPFVEDGAVRGDGEAGAPTLEVRHPARIAVYDDAAAAPRVLAPPPGHTPEPASRQPLAEL